MTLKIRNLDWIRTLKIDGAPEFGPRLYEAISDMAKATDTLAQQTNSNLSGNPAPPPRIQAVTVTPTETGAHVSITHEGEFYRGIEYHAEYSASPNFTNPFPVHMGPAREQDVPVGSKTLYWRAFAQYPTGSPTSAVYHGGTSPAAVTGGKSFPLGTSQGSGTGRAGEGIQGYGAQPFRSKTGAPPVRGSE